MENDNSQSQDNQLECLVCGHERFSRREVKLDLGSPIPDDRPTKSTAFCVVCEECGFVHWFFPTSKRGQA
jgi:hypothetical protein